MKHELKLTIDVNSQNVTSNDIMFVLNKHLPQITKVLHACFNVGVDAAISTCGEDKLDVLFEKWWELYGKKRGKKKTQAKWCRMAMKDKMACLHIVEEYVKSTPDKKFRKDPLTYLNGECWNDEILPSHKQEDILKDFV